MKDCTVKILLSIAEKFTLKKYQNLNSVLNFQKYPIFAA